MGAAASHADGDMAVVDLTPTDSSMYIDAPGMFEVVPDWNESRGQGDSISVMFQNDLGIEVRLEWLDWAGEAILYSVICPSVMYDFIEIQDFEIHNSIFEVETWSLHPWRIVDNRNMAELARVRFLKNCAVCVSELVKEADSLTRSLPLSWCAGLRFTLELPLEKQLAFVLSCSSRLGADSPARVLDEHALHMILDRCRTIETNDTSGFVDAAVCHTGPSIMQARETGLGFACDGDGNFIVADCDAGKVVKVRRTDASIVWEFPCETPLGLVSWAPGSLLAPSLDEQLVFAVSRADACVYVLRASDGQLVRLAWVCVPCSISCVCF